MTCERFWSEGVLLLEQGLPDPHRATCLSCRREFELHQELVYALRLVGSEQPSAPDWQESVWRRIERPVAQARGTWKWYLPYGLAGACSLLLLLCSDLPGRQGGARPRVEIVPGPVAVRTRAAHTGDHARITANATDEIRAYRGEHLIVTCKDGTVVPSCFGDQHGIVAEIALSIPSDYQFVVITARPMPAAGIFDMDLASLHAAGSEFQLTEIAVR